MSGLDAATKQSFQALKTVLDQVQGGTYRPMGAAAVAAAAAAVVEAALAPPAPAAAAAVAVS